MGYENDMVERFFKKYKILYNEVKTLNNELALKKDSICSITGKSFDEVKTSSGHHLGIEDLILNVLSMEEKLKKKQIKLNKLYEYYVFIIQKLHDQKLELILIKYYLESMSLDQISKILDVSLSHTKLLKKRAISKILKIIPNNTK